MPLDGLKKKYMALFNFNMPNLPIPSFRIVGDFCEGYIALFDNGRVNFLGDIKAIALLFAKDLILENKDLTLENGVVAITHNGSMKIMRNQDKSIIIDWVHETIQPPIEWNEFKKEFERIFKLKAFL